VNTTTQQTDTNNAHYKTLHSHKLGEEPKEATRELRRRHQQCATPKDTARCKPEQHPELPHHGTILLKPRTHTASEPLTQ
jgi:hypothetical protein